MGKRRLYLSEDGQRVMVRGRIVTADQAGIDLPDGECLIEISTVDWVDMMRELRERTSNDQH